MSTTLVTKSGRHARGSSERAGEAMRERRPFANSSKSLRGEPMTPRPGVHVSTGRMPREHAADLRAAEVVDYVVWSYATPIGWHDEHGWHVPATTYSPTTTQHQHTARMGVHHSGEERADEE
jgi:hypothetical protein